MTIKKINNAIWNRIYTAFVKSVFHKYSIRYGKNLFVMNDLPILHLSQQHGNIEIGDNFTINSSNNETSWYSKSAITVKHGASLFIGNNVGINGALIYCSNEVTIGDFSIIGGATRVMDTNFHSVDYKVRRDKKRFCECVSKPIHIGEDVFIGTNCIICKGVTIGDRSVIAAGSVVVKDIPADCIAGGNPAKIIKHINQ